MQKWFFLLVLCVSAAPAFAGPANSFDCGIISGVTLAFRGVSEFSMPGEHDDNADFNAGAADRAYLEFDGVSFGLEDAVKLVQNPLYKTALSEIDNNLNDMHPKITGRGTAEDWKSYGDGFAQIFAATQNRLNTLKATVCGK